MQFCGKGDVSCNFCSEVTDDVDDWLDHCQENGCWYLYCDDCDECFGTPKETFEHYQRNRCCSDTEGGEWYGFCCKYLSTEKGFMDHCNMKHGGLNKCSRDAVMSCKCGRFRGDYEGYLSHIDKLGDVWYCEDCGQYLLEVSGNHIGHDLSHATHVDKLEDEGESRDGRIDDLDERVKAVSERVEAVARQVQEGDTELSGTRSLKQMWKRQDRMNSMLLQIQSRLTQLNTELQSCVAQLKAIQDNDHWETGPPTAMPTSPGYSEYSDYS
ncbi:hypothetical protein GNI_051270 [Gregarina niphandrodes]|uniref:Uncharacterized protein n=1 Tax=Gregarina niphandrodes TaxID=110365 RepID=A0A023B9B0_GRENI|nr:hypothetical protein GNI_051270 [Gregarina niphandrodes]EZG72384.1 hypothetical protein GNI_051270 [Gregarina niphandrodes]|eukprot:XP_011129782.1 hypothetical protein GNI_051270 [Gregarina niphandrodes]